MKIYFILAAEGLARLCSSQRSYTDYFIPPDSLEARTYSAHLTLQTNGINYLFHKHTLLVYVLLRFLRFKYLAQECKLSRYTAFQDPLRRNAGGWWGGCGTNTEV